MNFLLTLYGTFVQIGTLGATKCVHILIFEFICICLAYFSPLVIANFSLKEIYSIL